MKPDRLIPVLFTEMACPALRPSETAVFSPDPRTDQLRPTDEFLVTDTLTKHDVTVDE